MNETSPGNQQSSPSALPDNWVGRIFDELLKLYGSRFADLWAGIDPAVMRAAWAQKLGGFINRPDCLKAAIVACDDIPSCPNLPQFLHLCRDAARRTGSQNLALPEPHMSMEEASERVREVAAIAAVKQDFSASTEWAKKLRIRYMAGERLLPIQISMASAALGETWALNGVEVSERLAA